MENVDKPLQDETTTEECYRALVVDSGPIIRLTGLSSLRDKAKHYYTVPAVFKEIRDAKARDHLENLPFELVAREASAEGIQAVVDFARQTGDYRNLSAVDLQVLGLLWDLEREGCDGDMSHVRKTPKRTVGVGKIQSLAVEEKQADEGDEQEADGDQVDDRSEEREVGEFFHSEAPPVDEATGKPAVNKPKGPSSWAALVNPSAANASVSPDACKVVDQTLGTRFGSMYLSLGPATRVDTLEGQYSDPDEEDSLDNDDEEKSENSDDEGYPNVDGEISDEECDVYILDPDEVEERKRVHNDQSIDTTGELQSEFPTLSATLQVPYEGSDDEKVPDPMVAIGLTKEKAEAKRQEALRPVTKSGKLYNSFRKYKDIVKPTPAIRRKTEEPPSRLLSTTDKPSIVEEESSNNSPQPNDGQSRIIGGISMSGQGTEVEDDGEGWITCPKDIRTMKAVGKVDPTLSPNSLRNGDAPKLSPGPSVDKRTACATTDFAMQNVILQMNLELMSVDGIKVRRLKSWVTRCGSCFTVYADGDDVGPFNTKRLFCSRCGSDFLQRISASVDGKTGRLRLHLSKKHKNNLRGTKFSLPKPGTGNRFQGDLLLREDQLMMGAWNQKVKQRSGGKSRRAAESIFGSDLASNVGCNAQLVKDSDISVGFGRRNPNASKYGRERRGKKKKTSDKACGLRRYH